MEKKSCFLKAFGIMLLCVLFATQANAQEITVTGTVTDNFGPVIGASVVVDGTRFIYRLFVSIIVSFYSMYMPMSDFYC